MLLFNRYSLAGLPVTIAAAWLAASWQSLPVRHPAGTPLADGATPAGERTGLYKSPHSAAFAPDGTFLCVSFSGSDTLAVINAEDRRVECEIPVGREPRGVAVSSNGRTAYVAHFRGRSVGVVDLVGRRMTAEIPVGAYPDAVLLGKAGNRLWVANWGTSDVTLIDRAAGVVVKTIPVDGRPERLAESPDGKTLFVLCDGKELVSIDAAAGAVPADQTRTFDVKTRAIAVDPLGRGIVTVGQRVHNYRPATRIDGGWVFSDVITLQPLTGLAGKFDFAFLDEPNRYWADPSDVHVTPNGETVLVISSAGHAVLMLDTERLRQDIQSIEGRRRRGGEKRGGGKFDFGRDDAKDETTDDVTSTNTYLRARVPTGLNPRRGALSPDGGFLWCCSPLDDSLTVVDVTWRTSQRVAVGNQPVDPARRGEQIFNDGRFCGKAAFTCASCHPDGHTDGLDWDLARDGVHRKLIRVRYYSRVDGFPTKSLLGIADTEPFGRQGESPDLRDRIKGTFRHPMRRTVSDADADAVAAYLNSLQPPPSPHPLDESARRGKALFHGTAKCTQCHSGPLMTNGERRRLTVSRFWHEDRELDVPSLRGFWMRYHEMPLNHGGASLGSKEENELRAYLKTL